jgi:hypothetical protein
MTQRSEGQQAGSGGLANGPRTRGTAIGSALAAGPTLTAARSIVAPLDPVAYVYASLDYDRVVPKTFMENLPVGSSGRYIPSMARSAGPLLGLDPDRLRNLTPSLSPTVPRLTVITPMEQQ